MSKLQQLVLGLKKYGGHKGIIHKTSFRSFSFCYNDIFSYSQKVSSYFSKHKIKKGDRVLIWGPNCPEYISLLFGCFLSGVVAVPVDIKHPLDTVKRIARHSGAKHVFCPAEFANIGKKRTNLSDFFYLLDEISAHKEKVKVPDSALAQIIYTSGTTGIPKGVMLTHKNISSNFSQITKIYLLRDKRVLNILPLSHSFSQAITFLSLFSGNTLILLDVLKPSLLVECIKEHKITHMPTVPRILDGLKKKLPFPARISSRIVFGSQFEYFIVGGAPLSEDTQHYFSCLDYPCYIGYGLTETSPVLTMTYPGHAKPGSAGTAVSGTKVKITGDKEVLAKGPQVFKGYYKNAKQTKDTFSSGWFCTGDVGSIDEDGFLFLQGRKKDVIVTPAGVNVYPEDIESVLNKQSAVKDSCVIGVGESGDHVHAVLLLSGKGAAKKIVEHANSKLDQSSRISEWSIWPEPDFPRTPTAKVRKFLVKEWVEKSSTKSKASSVSHDRLVQILSGFTSKKIKESSSLESLGLSSLDRVELISTLEQMYSIDLDEDKFTSTLKVKELRKLLLHSSGSKKPTTWQLSLPVRAVRKLITPLLVTLFARPFVRLDVKGLENLHDIDEPAIFIANHSSHFDTVFMFWSLPSRISSRLCPATWKEYFFSKNVIKRFGLKLLEIFVKVLYPLFLLPQKSGAMKSLHHMGFLLDKGYHILFFPEGARTRNGRPLGFMPGIGLLAKNTRAPVVPVKIEGLFEVLPADTFLPKRGKARYTFGKPVRFTTESPLEITKKLEKILDSL